LVSSRVDILSFAESSDIPRENLQSRFLLWDFNPVTGCLSPVEEQPAERVTLSHYIYAKSTGEKERFSGRFHPFLTRSSPGILTRSAGVFANMRVNIFG
jgi:hypothetical protein